ncbi:outer membrane protein assembly factor BamB family protein [Streptacidiphilus cavernicola]|uniref:PQQ-binding-like beta-propeller repeat protein n=1 Tax=Streptacidiphilus cavernicola TaxID=3342716 RepID=A0ABV6VS29_9ACTN
MAENTTGQGGQPPEDHPQTVLDGSSANAPADAPPAVTSSAADSPAVTPPSASPSAAPPPGYTPTELYQPPAAAPQGPAQPPQGGQPQYTPTQLATPPQGQAPQGGPQAQAGQPQAQGGPQAQAGQPQAPQGGQALQGGQAYPGAAQQAQQPQPQPQGGQAYPPAQGGGVPPQAQGVPPQGGQAYAPVQAAGAASQPPQGGQAAYPAAQGGPAYAPTQGYPPQGQPQAPAPSYGGGYGYPQVQQGGGYPPQGQGGYPQQPGSYPPPQASPQQGFPPAQGYPAGQGQGYPAPVPPPMQGYPQTQGYPQQGYPVAAPAPRRGIRKGAVLGIIGGVLALAIVGTVIAVVNNSGGSHGKDANTLNAAWTVASMGSGDQMVGSWVTSTELVRAGTGTGVVAYDLATGHKLWTLTPPSDATKPCTMSPTVNSAGIGTIGFGTDTHSCSYVAGVDTATGQILWKVDLTDSSDPTASSADTFVQGSVATVLSLGRAGGFDTKTGKEIWLNPARGKYCNEEAFGTTGAVVVNDFCADVTPEQTLTALNPATGKRLWRKTESQSVIEGYFLNGSPLVAMLSSNSKGPVSIYSSTGTAKQLDMSNFTLDNNSPTSVKLGQTLVAQSAEDLSDSTSTAGQVVAFDLGTGDQLWRYNGESDHGAVLVQTTSGSNVYAISTGTYSGSPHFVQLDPVTGKSTIIGALPSDANDWFVSEDVLYALPNGGLLTLVAGYQNPSTPSIEYYSKSK